MDRGPQTQPDSRHSDAPPSDGNDVETLVAPENAPVSATEATAAPEKEFVTRVEPHGEPDVAQLEHAAKHDSDAAKAAVSAKGRVLLLDDEPAFREVIRDFLAESGYTVVAVQNGTDGIRELLAGDFALILCDMRMPKLSGEIFYRAVERIRPHLCRRFVFMSGYRNDAKTNAFIESVNGFLLRKPFPLGELLDWLAVTEVYSAHEITPEPAAPVSFFPQVAPPVAEIPVIAPLPQTEAATDWISGTGNGTRGRRDSFARAKSFAAFVILCGITGGLFSRYWDARDRLATVSIERRWCEREWAAMAQDLEKVAAERSKLELTQRQVAWVSVDRAKQRWTPVLRHIAAASEAGIEILEVQARGEKENPGACEVRVSGIAGGAQPMKTADWFRRAVEEKLKGNSNGRLVTVRFEKLDEADDALPQNERADFVMIATLGAMEPELADGKESR